MTKMLRWTATISYYNDRVDILQIDELEDLQDIVEAGPDFSFIKHIKIEYNYGH